MSLEDQLENLFPDHIPTEEEKTTEVDHNLWLQEEPLLCKFEKRKGKVNTIIEGYTGDNQDFKELAKMLKTFLGVGGSTKNEQIIIQGDYRDKIMQYLHEEGFKV